jgi:hypothetical protein
MNQIAKLYQTKCIQLQEQIENLERLLEASQSSTASDKAWQDANKKAMADAVAKAQEEKEKKEAEEAAKPKEPDTVFSELKKDYSTFYDIGKGILGGLIGLQALPRWGGEQQQAGTLPSVETYETIIDKTTGKPVRVPITPTVVPGQPGKAGSMFGRFPVSTAKLGLGIPLPIGGVHGVAERIDKYVENRAISAANKAAEVQVGALKDVSKAEEGVKAAQDALDAIPVIPSFAPNLAQAKDELTAAQQNMSDAQEAAKAAEAEALAKKIDARNRINKASLPGRLTRAVGGAAAVAADASGILPGAFNILDTLATDIPKQALSAAPAVLPAQGMVGSEVAAKAKDLAAKTASAGGKALGFLSPLETAASEVAGIGARALGLGAVGARAAFMAPLAIGGITRSAGGTEMRGSIEGMPFPPGVNSMEEYDEYLEKQRKQQNASSVQSLVGRGYNPEGRSATQRQ